MTDDAQTGGVVGVLGEDWRRIFGGARCEMLTEVRAFDALFFGWRMIFLKGSPKGAREND